MTNFPADIQACNLSFIVVREHDQFTSYSWKLPVDSFAVRNEEWTILKTEIDTHVIDLGLLERKFVVFHVELKPTSKFFQKFVMAPVTIMYYMSSLVFLIPVETSNKVDFILSVFKSVTSNYNVMSYSV